jgi:hypothetical protein
MRLRGRHQRQLVFKDSLNYFFCALDALPRAFGLQQRVSEKPFFPYMYIHRQQLHQRLPGLPAMEHYQPEWMKPDKREQFLRWYPQENARCRFQLREQLILYCMCLCPKGKYLPLKIFDKILAILGANDVAILRESALRFRQLISVNTQQLDPFLAASTGAGLAMATLRRCFLPENKMVHSPEGGYLRGRRASVESQRYIRLFELQHPEAAGQIQCAQWAIGEAHVEDSGYRLDGLWYRRPPLRPLAIEYMGCYYHG